MPFRFSVDGQYIDDIEKMDFDDVYGIRKIISGDFNLTTISIPIKVMVPISMRFCRGWNSYCQH